MITKTTYKTREAWLTARNNSPVMGSSDVGTIMGLNPYCTPYQYWVNHKTPREPEEENANLLRGRFKEDAIARIFEHVTGEKIIKRSAGIEVYRNDKYPEYMQVAPDREVFARGRDSRYVVECKDTRIYLPVINRETMPRSWFVQMQYQMGHMGRTGSYLAVEDGNKDFNYAFFEFNPELFEYIAEVCSAWFERYILGDDVPPVESGEDAALKWPEATKGTKIVTEAAVAAVDEIKSLKKQRDELTKRIEALEGDIKIQFEDFEGLEYEGMTFATYKTIRQKRIDAKLLCEKFPAIAKKVEKEVTFRKLVLK